MKSFLLFTCIELIAVILGYLRCPALKSGWMDREYTTALKGISMLTILWCHVGQRYDIRGIQFIGSVGVSLFILFSGYGLKLSVEANGLKHYWKKRIIHVAMPYWIAEAVGLYASGRLTLKRYLLDCLFIEPAIGPGWFMKYIMICYLIFYLICVLCEKTGRKNDWQSETVLLTGAFLIWFVVDSVFFAIPAMPFLKARQMLCFPFGVVLAKDRTRFERIFTIWKTILTGVVTGLLFMGITQLPAIKALPYLIQNLLSLLTLFPLAIAVLALTKQHEWLLNNTVMKLAGIISFEIYLVHPFAVELLQTSLHSIGVFLLITILGAWLFHMFLREVYRIWQT